MLLMPSPAFAGAREPQEPVELTELAETELEGYNIAEWDEWLSELYGDLSVSELLSGSGQIDMEKSFENVKTALMGAIGESASKMGGLLVTAVLTGVVSLLADGSKSGVKDVAMLVCMGLCVASAGAGMCELFILARDAVSSMAGFAERASPVLCVMLTACGGTASAGIVSPLMAFMSGTAASLIENGLLPLILASGAVAIAAGFTGKAQLSSLSTLMRSIVKWCMGLMFTLYIGTMTVSGISAGTADSIGIRAARYAVDKSLPIVGGAVAGTMDTVLASSILVKNAAGAATAAIIAGIVLVPVIRLAASSLCLRMAAAVTEPVSDARMPKLLGSMADCINFMTAAMAACGVMFAVTAGLTCALCS